MLLHVPMCFCMALMVYSIGMNMKTVLAVSMLQHKKRNVRSLIAILSSKQAALKKMMLVTTLSTVLLIVWLSQAVVSRYVSEHYFDTVCVYGGAF